MVKVYRYRKYDITIDDYCYSTRMGTQQWIDRIQAERIEGTEAEIDEKLVTPEGYTAKDFEPQNRSNWSCR